MERIKVTATPRDYVKIGNSDFRISNGLVNTCPVCHKSYHAHPVIRDQTQYTRLCNGELIWLE